LRPPERTCANAAALRSSSITSDEARKPLIGVDHLLGHVAANFLEPEPLDPPFLCLIASGGHTLLAGVREPASFDGYSVAVANSGVFVLASTMAPCGFALLLPRLMALLTKS